MIATRHLPRRVRAASPSLRLRPARAALAQRSSGFTLIELMVAVAIAAILSAIALPSLEGAMQRARRADALVAMIQIQLAQERFRSNAMSYGSLAEIAVAAVSPAGSYQLQIVGAPSPNGYEALASAIGAQARDAACRHLQLRMAGGNAVHASGPDTSVANPADVNRRCWSL